MSAGSTPEAATPRIQFAPEDDVAIRYMDRTREYYEALGFSPYPWAHFTDAPFTPLRIPLANARVALITTATPCQPEPGDPAPPPALPSAHQRTPAHPSPRHPH